MKFPTCDVHYYYESNNFARVNLIYLEFIIFYGARVFHCMYYILRITFGNLLELRVLKIFYICRNVINSLFSTNL